MRVSEPPHLPPPHRPLHVAAGLELAGQLTTALMSGVLLGFLLLDTQAWRRGEGFSGLSIALSAVLGTCVIAPAALGWLAGGRMRRQRGNPALLPGSPGWFVFAAFLAAGCGMSLLLGFPD